MITMINYDFNRLEERTLSAVSQQIQTIQEHLKSEMTDKTNTTVELVGKEVKVHPDMAMSTCNIKRDRINKIKVAMSESGESNIDESKIAENLPEQEILIQSVCETMELKLMVENIPLLFSPLNDVFPGVSMCGIVWFIEDVLSTDMIFTNRIIDFEVSRVLSLT